MLNWQPYVEGKAEDAHSVVGDLRVLGDFHSPQLNNKRDIYVYLPPSYWHSENRYPVLYMHDGQNLFDHATSFSGEWHVDETMQALAHEGIEAIVVGIPNAGERRINEYNPYDHPRFGRGAGEPYLRFIVETLKPVIDRDFRTQPERERTGLLGSSLGGLISLYGFFRFPATFGMAGVLSPAFWVTRGSIMEMVKNSPHVQGRIYLDVGTHEIRTRTNELFFNLPSRRYASGVRGMNHLLMDKGYRSGESLLYIEEQDAAHNEEAWARRLPAALRFLLRGITS
jgi:predicted alpha/beta superfamily hydrolase